MSQEDRAYYEELVHKALYPAPRARDPPTFPDFVRKLLLREVRDENVRYYGRLAERGYQLDALYPGLDYSSQAARNRLGQFPHHRRLFEAFDQLHLSKHEIDLLCIWEGTKSARDRYEMEKNIKVPDPVWDHLPPPSPRRVPTIIHHADMRTPDRGESPVQVCPGAPIRRDYYGDAKIWGSFSPPFGVRGTVHSFGSPRPRRRYVNLLGAADRPLHPSAPVPMHPALAELQENGNLNNDYITSNNTVPAGSLRSLVSRAIPASQVASAGILHWSTQLRVRRTLEEAGARQPSPPISPPQSPRRTLFPSTPSSPPSRQVHFRVPSVSRVYSLDELAYPSADFINPNLYGHTITLPQRLADNADSSSYSPAHTSTSTVDNGNEDSFTSASATRRGRRREESRSISRGSSFRSQRRRIATATADALAFVLRR